jgi:hypothetical protein
MHGLEATLPVAAAAADTGSGWARKQANAAVDGTVVAGCADGQARSEQIADLYPVHPLTRMPSGLLYLHRV